VLDLPEMTEVLLPIVTLLVGYAGSLFERPNEN
jgi:hypothetical protein